MKKKILRYTFLLLAVCAFLTACTWKKTDESNYDIYYLNMDMTCIVKERAYVDTDGDDQVTIAQKLLDQMEQEPETADLRRAISEKTITYKSVVSNGYMLTIDFSQNEYDKLTAQEDVLIRCAIVKTLCNQVPDIEYVAFTVSGQPMVGKNGKTIGVMSSDDIVENPDDNLGDNQKQNLTLYFANADGTALEEENRQVVYGAGTSMEKMVIKELIKGPEQNGLQATIPSETKLISISIVDGICYVNLDETFLNAQNDQIREKVILYSIVDSLAQVNGVEKVQISVAGDSNHKLRYEYDLSQQYTPDYGQLETAEEAGTENLTLPAAEKQEE